MNKNNKEKSKKTTIKSNKENLKKEYMKIGLLIFFIILIDQIVKIVVANNQNITIISGILELKLNDNPNTDFNTRLTYIATNIIVLIIIFKFMITKNQFITMRTRVFLSLIFAGGLSNVIDRIFRGYVLEYINFVGINNFPIFNIADVAFLIGWISFVAIFASFTAKEWKEKKNSTRN